MGNIIQGNFRRQLTPSLPFSLMTPSRGVLLLVNAACVASIRLAPATHNFHHTTAVGQRHAALVASVSERPATALATGDSISSAEPLHVIIAGAGVGGLTLANCLEQQQREGAQITYTVLERTTEFKRFGGPIQLASNAMQNFKAMDRETYDKIESLATWTGNRTNGIKDGIRDEWYAKFDLGSPAKARKMPYTCVVDRPDLQECLLEKTRPHVRNGAQITSYKSEGHGVSVSLKDGSTVHGDVLVGADGIWSTVRAKMRDEPAKGDGSGVSYSGYTVFAGELNYDGQDPTSGYTVYIGPLQYFVITDIGKGRYQWYAFLAREAGSEEKELKPKGVSPYLQDLFEGWSPDVHRILKATREDEIEQRDLYDWPPSVIKKWGDGKATLLGDSVHAMMPNLGQGGCQAIEDAMVLSQELSLLKSRGDVSGALQAYRSRRLARSAAVQGLSRFASDIIIKGFDTPAKIGWGEKGLIAENLNYAGIVTRLLQPVLPVFFSIQFNFLYSGWRNKPFALEPIREFFILAPAVLTGGLFVDALMGGEAAAVYSGSISEQFVEIVEGFAKFGG